MLAFIPPVINAHGYEEYDDADKIDTRLHQMIVSTWILAAVFAGLAIINLLTCKVYARREAKAEEVRRAGRSDVGLY